MAMWKVRKQNATNDVSSPGLFFLDTYIVGIMYKSFLKQFAFMYKIQSRISRNVFLFLFLFIFIL